MSEENTRGAFAAAAEAVGAAVVTCASAAEVAAYIAEHAGGAVVLPACPSLERLGLAPLLSEAGVEPAAPDRQRSAAASAGLTGANFAIAETGTVVLESTDEAVRLASTLPERHFVLLDPAKILRDSLEAVPLLRRFHQEQPANYLAYITGPSRTADIERVLTIGVHGPKELHILLLEGLSGDPMEL